MNVSKTKVAMVMALATGAAVFMNTAAAEEYCPGGVCTPMPEGEPDINYHVEYHHIQQKKAAARTVVEHRRVEHLAPPPVVTVSEHHSWCPQPVTATVYPTHGACFDHVSCNKTTPVTYRR